MGAYDYAAIDASGAEKRGIIEAAHPAAAAAELRRRGIFVTRLEEASAGARAGPGDRPDGRRGAAGAPGGIRASLPVRTRDLVFFFRQMALMQRTGLTLLQGLDVARTQCRKARLGAAIEAIEADVRAGIALSQALGRHDRLFPEVARKLVAAAEASGELEVVLERIALHLERRLALMTNLLTSLIYPVVVLLVSGGVVAFLVTKVIPKFARFFERRSVAVPAATRLLLDSAALFERYGLAIGIGLAATLVVLSVAYRSPRGRAAIDRAALRIPMVGTLFVTASMAELGRTLAMLLRSGVTLLESLRIAASAARNSAVAQRLGAAAEDVLRGSDLASSLRRGDGREEDGVIPPLVAQIVAVGERSGALDQVLDEIGAYYDGELETRLRRIAALFEPVVVVAIGGIVGVVYFAFFQAVFQLAQAGR